MNTPKKTRGLGAGKAADLTYWESAARMIADVSKSDKIVVEKLTVPVKTAEPIERILTHNSKGINYQILSNLEFLAEETAIQDLFRPDRVLIRGRETTKGQKEIQALKAIYAHWVPEGNIICTNLSKTNFARAKKNPIATSEASPRVIQMKHSQKAKSPPPAKGIVIKEPSPNTGRPTIEEVVGKGRGKAEKPPQKAKHTSIFHPSSSRTN
ncbi:UDP-glucose/GDP-mannose dehydrogenase [Forsythia ovata]|uniref:UDP-glucose/GDP-mannose dehydrogenase n=1 Tax=Forsythia ovata TaxID=205694 RepID=A0ABD1WU61_9LAMI